MKLSPTYQGLFESFVSRAKSNYGVSYEGHEVFLMHAGYLGIFQPDLLYQLWFNFRLYPKPNQPLPTEEIPVMVVSDLLLSGLCQEIGPETFLIEAELRQQLQQQLKQDPRFGPYRQQQLAAFLTQYGQRNYRSGSQQRLKELHEQVSTATLNPRQAATRLATQLKEAIEQDDQREQARLAMITDWFAGEDQAFDQLLQVTRHIQNTLRGESTSDLVLPGLQIAQEGEEGQFIRMPVPAHLQGSLVQHPDESSLFSEALRAEIEAVQEGKQVHLDLSNMSLAAIPASVGRLTQLRRLSLANNQLRTLQGLERLQQLERLDISSNQLTSLQGLEALPNLKALFAAGNPLQDIQSINSSLTLQGVNLSKGKLTDLTPLASLSSLRSLNLNDNQLRDLSPLAKLQNLRHLHLRNNQISNVSPLRRLENLIQLELAGNLLSLPSPLPSDPQRLLKLLEIPPVEQQSNIQQQTAQAFEAEIKPEIGVLPNLRRLAGDKGRLFALIIGINQYPADIAPLSGAVHDAKAIEALLYRKAEMQNWALWMLTLLDEQATRSNVIAGFQEHLTEAEEGDEVLIYFAGRGSQEICPKELLHLEPDGRNETFVLWDSRQEGQKDLADKEFATLLSEIGRNGPNITVWLDCSNRSSTTRAVEGPSDRNWQMDDRQHQLESYLLPKIKNKSGRVNLPSVPHVSFQAGRASDQVQELLIGQRVRGLFTYAIEEVIHQQVSNQSNQEFAHAVADRMSLRSQSQRPVFEAFQSADKESILLGGLTHFSSFFYYLDFDETADSWRLDGGSLGGLLPSNPATGEKSLLQVFPKGLPEEALQNPEMALGLFEVEIVAEHQAWGVLSDGSILDRNATYVARILSLPIQLIGLAFDDDSLAWQETFQQRLQSSQEASTYLQISPTNRAAWLVRATPQAWEVYRRAELGSKPIFVLQGNPEQGLSTLVEKLVHVAKFQATLQLRNPNSRIPANRLDLSLEAASQPGASFGPGNNGYVVQLEEEGQRVRLSIQIQNRSDTPLYFALLYASSNFSITAQLVPEGVAYLEPGERYVAFEGKPISVQFSRNQVEWGRTEYQESFLLIASDRAFEPRVLELGNLQSPVENTRSISSFTNTTQLLFDSANPYDHQQDWTVKRVNVTFRLDR